jgi:serine/threonine-protein kinase ATR
MARLTDVINDSISLQPPIMEQRTSIGALEELIKVSKHYARIARPQVCCVNVVDFTMMWSNLLQISACLLAAIAQEPLRESTFSCWAAMLTHLEEDDVSALLATTFFIVDHYWNTMNATTATIAKELLLSLLDKHGPMVKRHVSELPSLASCKGLEQVEKSLNAMRPTQSMEEALVVFAGRIGHDNAGVVHQALSELCPYLRDNQNSLYASAVSQRPDNAITKVLRSLLDCACKYSGIQVEITRLCVQCTGLIGCLDSNQIETVREQQSIVVLNNFEVPEELTDFGLFLLREVLVPSFLSATDTKLQGFLSYAIQELLDKCDIRAACAMYETGMAGASEIYRKWIALPEHAREVMTPFLSSRYMVAPMPPVTVEYPIFHPGKPYGNWLRSFVIDMLRKGQDPHADLLFEPLMRVIRVKDLSTAEFLLPYLVLHILLGSRSSGDEKDQIVNELLAVLRHQPADDASYVEREELKRFCHVSEDRSRFSYCY